MSWTHFMLTLISSTPPPEDRPLSVTTADVRKLLLRVNTHEAADPDNMPGLVLKNMCRSASWCYYYIFNILLSQDTVRSSLNTAISSLVPKKSAVSSLTPHLNEVLQETGSPAHQRQHPSQPGPSPVYFQNQQIHRGCHIYCPSPRLHTPWE